MVKNVTGQYWIVASAVCAAMVALPLAGIAEVSKDLVVRQLLATVHAFRTLYVENITERLQRVGIQPKEDWMRDDHAIMLPFQFVKVAGQEIKSLVKNVDVGLVSLTPLYSVNFPKTEAEVAALQKLMANPNLKVVTFTDGKEFKGISPDFAIEQSCAARPFGL